MGDFLAGGGGDISESGWVRLGCLLVGCSGRRRWRLGEGGGDISVARRAFLGRLRRLDGARGVGGLSLEGRGGDGSASCIAVSSGWVCSGMVSRVGTVWGCVILGRTGGVSLFGLKGSGWLFGGGRGRCRLLWGWHGQ